MTMEKVYFHTSENMSELADKSVDVIVTSPPYWKLKNYCNNGKQIGKGDSYNDYQKRLGKVWRECYRVLKSFGTLWINVNTHSHKKSLTIIPNGIIKNAKKAGFVLKDIIIWHKTCSMAGLTKKNLVDRFEYILFFSKTPKRFKINKNFSLENPDYLEPDTKDNNINIWLINRRCGSISKNKKTYHEAIYPAEFVRRILLLTTEEGDTVLDPFLGSGTTLKVAKKLGRTCIGYEINEEYKKFIEEN